MSSKYILTHLGGSLGKTTHSRHKVVSFQAGQITVSKRRTLQTNAHMCTGLLCDFVTASAEDALRVTRTL